MAFGLKREGEREKKGGEGERERGNEGGREKERKDRGEGQRHTEEYSV